MDPLSPIQVLRPQLAEAANRVLQENAAYRGSCSREDWEHEGGICDEIADAMAEVLTEAGIDAITHEATVGPQHTFVIARAADGDAAVVDVPFGVYEIERHTYVFDLIPGAVITTADIVIEDLGDDFRNYLDRDDDDEVRTPRGTAGAPPLTNEPVLPPREPAPIVVPPPQPIRTEKGLAYRDYTGRLIPVAARPTPKVKKQVHRRTVEVAPDPVENILTVPERKAFYRRHAFRVRPEKYTFTPSPNPPGFTFWLGCPFPAWLQRTNVPLFISIRRLLQTKELKAVKEPPYVDPRFGDPRAIPQWPAASIEEAMTRWYQPQHMQRFWMPRGKPQAGLRRLLVNRTRHPVARGPWAVDSGGFSFLRSYGLYPLTGAEWAAWYAFFADTIGNLQWGAVQDYMCEPEQLVLRTPGIENPQLLDAARRRLAQINASLPLDQQLGTTEWNLTFGQQVLAHQQLTVESFLELDQYDLNLVPVVQGFREREYYRMVWMYAQAGVQLAQEPLVGVGSVCRRQETSGAQLMINTLASIFGLAIHGFGFKLSGLPAIWRNLRSSDSMAWSFAGRKRSRVGEAPTHDDEGQLVKNSLRYALLWRERLIATLVLQDADEDRTWQWPGRRRNDVDLRAWHAEMGLPDPQLVLEQTNFMRGDDDATASTEDDDVD